MPYADANHRINHFGMAVEGKSLHWRHKGCTTVDWKSYTLTHCAEKLQLLTILSPVLPLGNTVLS